MKKIISALTILLSLNSFALVNLDNAREGDPNASLSLKANPSDVDAGVNAPAAINCPACAAIQRDQADYLSSTQGIATATSSTTPSNKVAPALDNNDPVNIGR